MFEGSQVALTDIRPHLANGDSRPIPFGACPREQKQQQRRL